jgi:pimeloyl-ACP methyl ester carboxylesterase
MAKDALALIQTLGIEKPLICGIGDGACIALQMAIWSPEVAAAYVFMAAWLWNAKEEPRRGMLVVQDVLGLDGPLRVQPAWISLTEHGATELQRITTPSLVVVGDRDPYQPLNEAVELYRHLPNAELAVIPGMDHDAILGSRAELLSEVILNFLLRQVETSPNI